MVHVSSSAFPLLAPGLQLQWLESRLYCIVIFNSNETMCMLPCTYFKLVSVLTLDFNPSSSTCPGSIFLYLRLPFLFLFFVPLCNIYHRERREEHVRVRFDYT